MTLIEPQPPTEVPVQRTDDSTDALTRNEVKAWLKKIENAEVKWEKEAFKAMKENIDFAAGFQWQGQQELHDERYKNNIVLHLVNQKVASLYAKNPTPQVKRRDRMDYQIWDGKDINEMADAIEIITMATQMGVPPPMEALALVEDYENGRRMQKVVDRVCETLEKAVAWHWDNSYPDFKEQMKQMVRRVIICKVGYVKVSLCRYATEPGYEALSSVVPDNSQAARADKAQFILSELQKGDIDETSPEVGELKSLLTSLGATQAGLDAPEVSERLDFDFPMSNSIIPSEECRSLKDFVAATWVAQKYTIDTAIVEALFGVEISSTETDTGASATEYKEHGDKKDKKTTELYEVFDANTKMRFFIAKGYKDYVLPPEPVEPQIKGFWPIFALTFNDIEGSSDSDSKAGIFPPSDVDLLRDMQKEWNRTRDALRSQRNANAPKYLMRDGLISEEDEQAIQNAQPNRVVKLKGLTPEAEPDKFIKILQVAAIDPAVYDTAPLEKDMLMAVGMQQANVGPAEADVTATVGTIAEQSRLSGVSSNVDDLDGLLSRLNKACVEIMLRGMSPESMKVFAGVGAAHPTNDVDMYLNMLNIDVVAASSGRPNKAMEVSMIQGLAPILLQAGANPSTVIREIVNRADDRLDVDDFLPVMPTVGAMMGAGQQPQGGQAPGGGQKMLGPQQEKQGLASQQVPQTM